MNNINLEEDISKAYLDYAMSVIVSRALPDVRDGLKPVQRRILFDMNELGITHDKPYKKCARTVGDVLGKYHPHGDSSVYDALTRMAQDFVMRYQLIDGHGNFGSADGDEPASMRYTEARMSKLSTQMLRDINKNTVDFIPNFDGEETEPVILPARFPNLLVNGVSGIAVGFASNMPPHNLTDTINTILYQIDNPNCNIDELIDILKAPDFPTKGAIINPQEVRDIYKNGRGKIIIRGKYHFETIDKKESIVFTEIPYGVNTSSLKDNLYNLINGYTKKDKKGKKIIEVSIPPVIPEIEKMDDETNRLGTRLIFKLKNGANKNKVLSLLFKHSDLQKNFGANFVAIKENKLLRNEDMTLKHIIKYYIDHQKEVLTRRCKYDLSKAKKRIHILEGLKIAIANIRKVIEVVEKSKNKKECIDNLTKELNLTEIQASSVVELRIYRLSGIEIEDINREYNELQNTVIYLKEVLDDESKLLALLKSELIEIRDKYGDKRQTEILHEDTLQEISADELIEEYNCRLLHTKEGYIKKHLKQSDNHKLKDGDIILSDITSTNKSTILLFTNKGNRYSIPCHQLETLTPQSFGTFIPNLINLEEGEEVIKIVSVEEPKGYIISCYTNGKIAKVDINSYMSANKKLANCYSKESDLLQIEYIKDDIDVLLVSTEGKALVVNTSNINPKGSRSSQGNIAMKLDNHSIVGCIIDVDKDAKFEIATKKGKNKEFLLDDIAPTNRPNEERNLLAYISGRCGNGGNFLINTRTNNDLIKEFKIIK